MGTIPIKISYLIYIESPNGVWFCSKTHREGVLPKMLSEILDVRVQLKRVIKGLGKDSDKVFE